MSCLNVGIWGEMEACRYLQRCGYQIVERNFRCKIGEVDIVAKKKDILYFFEVKTRRSLAYGVPAESIDRKKRGHIRRVVQFYLISHYIMDVDFQIDVIEILVFEEKTYVRHTENAFA